jgi:DNA-binding transcriptional LysR family regulator
MDRFDALSTFLLVSELRSFTAAARKLGVSTSAVGKTISRLEDGLGARLFHRSTRSVTLTTEGEIFLHRCRRIVEEFEAVELEIAQVTQGPKGRLRVSMPLAGMLLTPVISAFAKAYPDINLDIEFSDRLVDVIEEGFDVVVRTGPAADSLLMSKIIGQYGYVIVGSLAYLAEHGTPQEPEDLLSHVCLHYRWSTAGKLESWRLMRDGAYLDLALPASFIANTTEPLIGLAERGIGLTSLSAFTVRRQLDEGSLVAVLERYLTDRNVFRLMWPPGRQALPRLRAFIDFMTEHLPAYLPPV